MSETQDIPKSIGEIERRISDGEALISRTNDISIVGWFFILIGAILIIFKGSEIGIVIGILMIGASIWRIYKADQMKKEINNDLREYRGQKAELQARLLARG